MKNFKYVLMVFAGGSLYGTMSSFVKLSYERGFNAAASAVIMTVELPVAVLCAAAVLGERVGALQVAGIAAMLFGIALMNLRKARAG